MHWPMLGKLRLYLKLWELGLASTSMEPEADEDGSDLSEGRQTIKGSKMKMWDNGANNELVQVKQGAFKESVTGMH